MPTEFGPWIDAATARDKLAAHIERWAPTYTAEAIRATGIDDLREPVIPPADVRSQPLPAGDTCMLTLHTGRTLPGRRAGDGSYRVTFETRVTQTVHGGTYADAERRNSAYALLIVQAVLQHRSLGGFAQDTQWMGTTPTPPQQDESAVRYVAYSTSTFNIVVDSALSDTAGPVEPVPDPWHVPTLPIATSLHIDVENTEPGST